MSTQVPSSGCHIVTTDNNMLDNLPKNSSPITNVGSSGIPSMGRGMRSLGGETHTITRGCNTGNTGMPTIGNLHYNSLDIMHGSLPIQFKDFCLISVGKFDPRPSYHNTSQMFPVGYRCSWHDRITGSLFLCDIADGGSSGPIFKVKRYPCSKLSLPRGNTVLSIKKPGFGEGDCTVLRCDSMEVQGVGDDNTSLINLLNENSPTSLDVALSVIHDEESQGTDAYFLLNDVEFEVESRSSSNAWEKVSRTILRICREHIERKGPIRFCCQHNMNGVSNENQDQSDSLSRYCYSNGPVDVQPLCQNETMFTSICERLSTWLSHDRFGLDTDFVQDIIEKLPGRGFATSYRTLDLRKSSEALQTIKSGFFLAEQTTGDKIGIIKKSQSHFSPAAKRLNPRLPSNLIDDALQVWKLALRFLEFRGIGERVTFKKFESELTGKVFSHGTQDFEDVVPFKGQPRSKATGASHGMRNGPFLTKIICSLLKLLTSELLSKVVVHLDARECKSQNGRFDMLPINELTWYEVARRYILSVLSVEGKLESADVISRESRKIFRCLQGDGGLLCGSLTSLVALQGDAVVLADSMKSIYGEYMAESDDPATPEWYQVLEGVRYLATNVGAPIRNRINKALEKNPPEWAKTILEHSISKEVYKGNAAAPAKNAAISVLQRLSSENLLPEAERIGKLTEKTNVADDLITKQCRIVLRRAASADKDKLFCNLLAKTTLSDNQNNDKGLLGNPGMVSRPLDFRSIDLRLAAGVYDGSHEAFLDDVREVWRNVRTIYSDKSDLIAEANSLSQIFEDLYDKEVQTLVSKIAKASTDNGEQEDILAHVAESLIPRAPWEDGICKTCGLDRDGEKILLCNSCGSAHHNYCLNLPVLQNHARIGYCPSCRASDSIPSSQGDIMHKSLETLTRLAKLVDEKDFKEYTLDEKIFFLKFFFKEVLNTVSISKGKSGENRQSHALGREETESVAISGNTDPLWVDSLASKGLKTLKAKFGPSSGNVRAGDCQNPASLARTFSIIRCDCLELVLESRVHCFSCHRTFQNEEQRQQHLADCEPVASVPKKNKRRTEDFSSRKKPRTMGFGKNCTYIKNALAGKPGSSGLRKYQAVSECPVETKLWRYVPNPLKDEHFGLSNLNGLSPSSSRLQQSNGATSVNTLKYFHRLLAPSENRLFDEGPSDSPMGPDSSLSQFTRDQIASESSSRLLVGQACHILKFLKMTLLDMEAALPEDALRPARWNQVRRDAWRVFVRSAWSIYEMVEAILVLEDAINPNFLSNSWWYWSSASTAAKISTLSALSLRIYALDAAILYEKPLAGAASEE